MYTHEEVIASGYFVFEEELSCHIVGYLLSELQGLNISLKDKETKRIFDYFYFEYPYYKLKKGISLEDISSYINFGLVMIFDDFKYQLENQNKSKNLIKK